MNYRIIGDSCMDLTEEQRKDPHFTLIPFTLMVEEAFSSDRKGEPGMPEDRLPVSGDI